MKFKGLLALDLTEGLSERAKFGAENIVCPKLFIAQASRACRVKDGEKQKRLELSSNIFATPKNMKFRNSLRVAPRGKSIQHVRDITTKWRKFGARVYLLAMRA